MSDLATDTALQLQVFANEHLDRQLRLRNLSTTELGARVGRSAFSVKLHREGKADPPAGVVGLMAYALGIPVEALFRPASPDEVEMTTVTAPRRIRKKS